MSFLSAELTIDATCIFLRRNCFIDPPLCLRLLVCQVIFDGLRLVCGFSFPSFSRIAGTQSLFLYLSIEMLLFELIDVQEKKSDYSQQQVRKSLNKMGLDLEGIWRMSCLDAVSA